MHFFSNSKTKIHILTLLWQKDYVQNDVPTLHSHSRTMNDVSIYSHTHTYTMAAFGLFTEMQNKTLDKQINAEEQKRNRKQ